jgi:putative FmdB family regulatory protein
MPTYEYRCEHCGDFEENQRITDPPLERCPKCRRKVRRLISNTSFQLKGSGWYVTDYARSGSSKDNAKSDKSGDGKSETKSESKSDGKSESKSESKTESKSDSKADSKPTSGGSTEKPAF